MQLKDLKKNFETNKKVFRKFIDDLEEAEHKGVKKQARQAEQEVWEEVNCLSCANCCKKMTPTLTGKDRKRIAHYLGMDAKQFKKTYLEHDKEEDDWRMQKQPCVFLDEETNKCSIYAVRPADCAGFPHLTKTPLKSYIYIHKQNIEYCPATYRFVEKMMERIEITKD
ncbi:MAG TPA: YkgJ family cysteine cluster protein [Phnomibacter sp.]|nr:YkgJ family cysteine cluster protein [Phnomibacter sp.]